LVELSKQRFNTISDRDRKALKLVFQEELEIKRRASRKTLQPSGALNAFNTAHGNMGDWMN
jgi:hypothetical protein